MTGIILMLLILVGGASFLLLWNQQRLAGRMLCFFLEEDKSTKPELRKIADDFIESEDGLYDIEPDRVRLIRYPTGWPPPLQQIIPTSLYCRGNARPLDWVTLRAREVSAKELKAVLDTHWLINLVRGAREGGGESKVSRILPLLSAALGAICMVLIFIILAKMGALESAVKVLRP